MKDYGRIDDNKDIATKKYVDEHGGGYELPVATDDVLGGIKLFGEAEERPENSIPVKLDHGKAYVDVVPANVFKFKWDSHDPDKTEWVTGNECGTSNIFTTLYDKDNNLAMAGIKATSTEITVTFKKPLQEGDEFTLLYSSNAGGTDSEDRFTKDDTLKTLKSVRLRSADDPSNPGKEYEVMTENAVAKVIANAFGLEYTETGNSLKKVLASILGITYDGDKTLAQMQYDQNFPIGVTTISDDEPVVPDNVGAYWVEGYAMGLTIWKRIV